MEILERKSRFLVLTSVWLISAGTTTTSLADISSSSASLVAPSTGAIDSVLARSPIPFSVNSCTENERWLTLDGIKISKFLATPTEFQLLVSGKGSKVVAFSEALAARRFAGTAQEKILSEYWLSRSLLESGMTQLAFQGFSAIVNREVQLETVSSQIAALECLTVIHKKFPAFEMPGHLLSQLSNMDRTLSQNLPRGVNEKVFRKSIQRLALSLMLSKEYPENQSPSRSDPFWLQGLALVKGKGMYEALALGVFHSSMNAHSETIKDFGRFFSGPEVESAFFKPYISQARLLYGRALFGQGKFKEAVQQYRMINPRSNEWVHALSELSWTYLMDEKYQEAIGTAIGLQAGGFKQTFAPEVMMVMAMGLNEICRFPESMNVISHFRRRYHEAFRWLNSYGLNNLGKRNSGSRELAGLSIDYYQQAIEFTKKSPQFQAPVMIASEWIRSPIFISSQERINLIFEEKKLAELLSSQGKSEQRELTLALISSIRNLRNQYRQEKIRMKPGERIEDRLPASMKAEMQNVRSDLIKLRHLRRAAPYWRKMLASYQTKIPSIQAKSVNDVRREIERLNRRMLRQLSEIAENNELIEVEILNGASEDLIWQNANPEQAEKIKNAKIQKMNASAEKVWNWGSTQGGFDGGGEIWEDEVGSLSAEMYDNCKNKEKYSGV